MGRPYLALGRIEILCSTPWSTTTVVFSMAFRERLLEAVKNPMPVRLLSTLVKVEIWAGGTMVTGRFSTGCGGWVSTAVIDSSIKVYELQQQHKLGCA